MKGIGDVTRLQIKNSEQQSCVWPKSFVFILVCGNAHYPESTTQAAVGWLAARTNPSARLCFSLPLTGFHLLMPAASSTIFLTPFKTNFYVTIYGI